MWGGSKTSEWDRRNKRVSLRRDLNPVHPEYECRILQARTTSDKRRTRRSAGRGSQYERSARGYASSFNCLSDPSARYEAGSLRGENWSKSHCDIMGQCRLSVYQKHVYFSPLKTKRRLHYLKTQFVPRSKHFSSVIKTKQFMLKWHNSLFVLR